MRAAYRKGLKDAQRAPKQASWNRLHSAMASNDVDQFWKSWKTLYAKNKSHLSPVVDGVSSKEGIAESFRHSFERNARPNNQSKVDEVNSKFTEEYLKMSESHAENCTCSSYSFSIENVLDATFSLKPGKSADDDEFSAEHFLNAPFHVFVILRDLFNAMLRHSFVPKQFKFGTIIPIVKDHQGNLGEPNNYRGITISPIASKIFEHCLKFVFHDYLSTSSLQFGFKKKSSTSHALYCLKETVNYYIENGSRVYCAFLDASKAFDRLIHSGLFLKLLCRGVPKVFLDLIIFWYQGLSCRVKWGQAFSQWFEVMAGVRQGGILSPNFYCIYVDCLIEELEKLQVGCHVLNIFMAALFYADDMALLSPSIKGLQVLLDKCSEFCMEWDICLNDKKSKAMYFGKKCLNPSSLMLNAKSIDWVDTWRYLGIDLKTGSRFSCSANERIKKFYRCANAIFRIEGWSDDLTMLRLIESHCLPILTYGIEVTHFPDARERSKLRAAYNSLFRRIFGYRNYESVTELQLNLARPTWELLLDKFKNNFYSRIASCNATSPVHVFSIV